jgi:ATP-dependent Clp protease ATP-binding subunit ClpB
VERVRGRLRDRKIGLRVDESALQMLCEAGYDPSFGARPVKRAVQHLLETSLAQAILRGEVAENEQAVVWAHGEGEGRQLLVAKEEGQPQQQEPAQQEADPYAQMSWDN